MRIKVGVGIAAAAARSWLPGVEEGLMLRAAA